MAIVAITVADMPNGKPEITVFTEGQVEGEPLSPAFKLAVAMMKAGRGDAEDMDQVADVQVKTH